MRFIRNYNLSDWCVQVIADNLHRYMRNKTTPRKHIDFLFLMYSEAIYSLFSSKNSMTEECILWFLNQYNESLTLPTITPNIVAKLQDIGQGIASLTLRNSLASVEIVNSIMCCIPHVKYLDLKSSNCSDSTLLCINRMCPELITLDITSCEQVTNVGMENLNGHKAIKHLFATGCRINRLGIHAVLEGVPSLEIVEMENFPHEFYKAHEHYLKYYYTKVEEGILDVHASHTYNLTELILDESFNNNLYLLILAWNALCPYVKKVHFYFYVPNQILQLCTRFQNLEDLKIFGSNKFSAPVDFLTASPVLNVASNLQMLWLYSVEIPLVLLLENLRNLRSLYLDACRFSDFQAEDIKIHETKLEFLGINILFVENHSISDNALTLLFSLSKKVTTLYLHRILNLSQEHFLIIRNSMTTLSFLNIFLCEFEKSFSVEYIFQIPSLKKIYIDLALGAPASNDFIEKVSNFDYCTLFWHSLSSEICNVFSIEDSQIKQNLKSITMKLRNSENYNME